MKNYWNFALTLSTLLHAGLFLRLAVKPLPEKKTKVDKRQIEREVNMTVRGIDLKVKVKDDPIVSVVPKPYTENIMETLIKNTPLAAMAKAQIFEKKSNEIILSEIPPHDQILEKNPTYMNYYRAVREKIRSRVYKNYNNYKKDEGEVTATFVVLPDGRLQNIYLHPDSVANPVLRNIVLKSIEESAPFPLPPQLEKDSHLKFTIPIEFENN